MSFLKKKNLMAFLSLILVCSMAFTIPVFAIEDPDTPVSSDDESVSTENGGVSEPSGDEGVTEPSELETEITGGEAETEPFENETEIATGEGETEKTEDEGETEPVTYSKDFVLEQFNSSVNRVKTDLPKFSYASVSGMLVPKKQDGLLGLLGDLLGGIGGLVGNITGERVEELDGLMGYLFIDGKTEKDFKTIGKGEENKDLISVRGKDYVSDLKSTDEFTYEYTPFSFGGFNLKIDLPDEINPGLNSPLYRVFDIPTTESIYTMFYSFTTDFDWTKVQVKITNASLECRVNQKGELSYYRAHYEVSIAITDIAGVDLTNLNFPESMYVSEIELQNFDWTPRVLGDGNGDGVILAADARQCLRIAAGLAKASPVDFPYYDVNKDNKITAADARYILRASAKLIDLEKEFGKI